MQDILSHEREALQVVHKLLHARELKEAYAARGEYQKKILLAVEKREVGKVMRAVNGDFTTGFDITSLDLDGLTVTEPTRITSAVSEHFEQWFALAKDTHPGGIGSENACWRDLLDDWDGFHARYASTGIPKHLLKTLHEAISLRRGDPVVRESFRETVLRTPTLEEFSKSIKQRPANSAPGVSGLSNNMIKLWPPEVLERAYAALVELWEQRRIPEYWRWRYLVLLPKKDNPSLDDLRPLTLVETLRKIWVAIFVQRIQQYVTDSGVLSPNQHAYLWGKGTDTAAVHLLHGLETAKEYATDLYLTSWDKKRAFDSVSKATLIFTWVRIGVPPDLAEYMVDMDIGGALLARSPLVVREIKCNKRAAVRRRGFTTRRGAGQGDVPSALNYACFEDILLTALEIESRKADEPGDFFVQNAEGDCSTIPEIGYSDDLISMKSTLSALQRSADIVSAFCILFDIQLSMAKFRAFMILWSNSNRMTPDQLFIHTRGWVRMPVTLDTSGSFKHLGVVCDLDASSDTQFKLNLALVKKMVTALGPRRLPPAAKWLGLQASLYPKISYSTKFTTTPLHKLDELDTPIQGLIRKSSKLPHGFPNAVIYAHKDVCGLGFRSLSEYCMADKEAMFRRLSRTFPHVIGGLMRRGFVYAGAVPVRGVCVVCPPVDKPGQGWSCWASSILSYYTRMSITVCVPAVEPTPADTQVVDLRSEDGLPMLKLCDQLERVGIHLRGELAMEGDDLAPIHALIPDAVAILPCPRQALSLRLGQCWFLPQFPMSVIEVIGFEQFPPSVHILEWEVEHSPAVQVGKKVKTNLGRYTHGAGTGRLVEFDLWRVEGTSLVLLSKERNNKNAVIRRTILSIRERRARQIALPPLRSIDIEWGSATSCTTDGSWSQSGNVTQHLTNDLVTSCGAALVLTDGESFTGAVRITGEPSLHHHAFTVESIALATAIISRPDLPVYSDCKGAIGFIERCSHGRYRSNDLSWLTEPLRDRGHHLSWIPSHPEKTTPLHQFTMSQRAIYAADLLAGDEITAFCAYTGLEASSIQHLSDVDVLECLSQDLLFQLRYQGKPLTVLPSKLYKSKRFSKYQAERTSFRRASTPSLAGKLLRLSKKDKICYFGSRGSRQASLIAWDWHWTGERQARFGGQAVDHVPTDPALCPLCQTGPETQHHIALECTGGSMQRLRAYAQKAVYAEVTRAVRQHSPLSRYMEEFADLAFTHSHGHELWIGMLSPAMITCLEELTATIPFASAKAAASALVSLSKLLRLSLSDMYKERARLLTLKRTARSDSFPTTPTNHTALLAQLKKTGRSKAKKRKDTIGRPTPLTSPLRTIGSSLSPVSRISVGGNPSSRCTSMMTYELPPIQEEGLVDTQDEDPTRTGMDRWLGCASKRLKVTRSPSGDHPLTTRLKATVMTSFFRTSPLPHGTGAHCSGSPGGLGDRVGIGT